jgi:hypothetical protein
MATVTTITDLQGYAQPMEGDWAPFLAKQRVDFNVTPTAASDTIQVIKIPAGTYLVNVFVKVITAEGIALTAEVGDGADPNGWDASTDLNAAVGTVTQGISGTDAYALTGKIYTANDTIDLVMSAAIGNDAIVDVIAVGWKIY